MTDALAEQVFDVRTLELHWSELQPTASAVDVRTQPDGPGEHVFAVPGMQVVAQVPFSGTPALLEARPRRHRIGGPATTTVTVSTAQLAPLQIPVTAEEGQSISLPLAGYVSFSTGGRTHDEAAWTDQLGAWAERILWTAARAAAEVEEWRPNARAQLENAVSERRAQLDAARAAQPGRSSTDA